MDKLAKEQKGLTTQLKDLDKENNKYERRMLFINNQITDIVTRQNNLTSKIQVASTNEDQQSKQISAL